MGHLICSDNDREMDDYRRSAQMLDLAACTAFSPSQVSLPEINLSASSLAILEPSVPNLGIEEGEFIIQDGVGVTPASGIEMAPAPMSMGAIEVGCILGDSGDKVILAAATTARSTS